METIKNPMGYREVSFHIRDIKEILSNPDLMEKSSAEYESALSDFLAYTEKEGFDDDRFFRMTLAPDAFFTDGLRELMRVLEAFKNGNCTPFDDSDAAFAASTVTESSMQ